MVTCAHHRNCKYLISHWEWNGLSRCVALVSLGIESILMAFRSSYFQYSSSPLRARASGPGAPYLRRVRSALQAWDLACAAGACQDPQGIIFCIDLMQRLLVNCWLFLRMILAESSRELPSSAAWLVWDSSRRRRWSSTWFWSCRLPSWWTADCRPVCSSWALPSRSTTLVCWSSSATSVLASRWWTLLRSWFMWIRRSTSSSLRTLPTEAVVL